MRPKSFPLLVPRSVCADARVRAAEGGGSLREINEKLMLENEELKRQLLLTHSKKLQNSPAGLDAVMGAQHLLPPRSSVMSRALTRREVFTRGGGWAGGEDEGGGDIVFIEGLQRPADERIEELKR